MISCKNRIGKLDQAINLTSPPSNKEEVEIYHENFGKGLKLYNQLCLSNNLTPDDKLDVIVCFLKSVPDQGQDMLCKWRDMLQHLKGVESDDMVTLLCKVTRCSNISSHERMITAVSLYNNCFLAVCYICFMDIACDRSVLVNYRVDACRYLFGSQDYDYKQISQEALLEVIDTTQYPSDFRYKVIAGFISKTGINTLLNFTKLKVPYDEEFVYGLQTNFFYNEENNTRERILSGQHILQMICSDEKEEVGNILLKFASSSDNDENTRADAADVLLRLGTSDQKKKARKLIVDMGFSTVDSRKIGTGNLMDRTKTVYSNTQNIHEFQEQIDRFIEKIINETNISVKPFVEVHNEVSEYLRSNIKDRKQRFKAFKAMNRISIDTAQFTSHKVTLSEIFVHFWARINKYDNKIKEELKNRMAEELVDMGETCSSGHSGRFVNILSEVDVSLKISWKDQIISNMTGRMMARIRDCPDADLRARLAMAESELADEEDKDAYINFIKDNLHDLKNELYKEFVEGGYVKKGEFEKSFELGSKRWI